jgi:hypothetical protein
VTSPVSLWLGRVRATPRLSAALGLLTGAAFAWLAIVSSPLIAIMLLAGVSVTAGMFVWPFFGFLLMAAMAPLERFGRLTNDDSTFTFSVMRMLGFLSLAAFLIHWILRKRKLRAPSSLLWYGSYMALGVLSLSWTSDLHYGFNQTSMQLGNLMFFFVVLNIVEDIKKARIALAVWLCVTVAIGIYTVYQWNAGTAAVVQAEDYYNEGAALKTDERFAAVTYDIPEMHIERQKRAIGSTSHPGAYGLNLLLALPFFLYFFRTVSGFWMKLLVGASTLLTAYNVLLTNTRATLLTLVFLIVVSACTGLIRLRPSLVIGIVISAVAATALAPADLRDRIFRFDKWFSESQDTSFGDRLYLMKVSLEIFSENPLFGVGLGNQVDVPKRANLDWRDRAKSAHNDFVATLLEVGAVGFMLVAGFLVSLYRRFRLCKKVGLASGNPQLHMLVNAASVQLLCILFFGLQAEPLTLPIKGFWLTAGIVVALSQTIIERARAVESSPGGQTLAHPALPL